GRGAGVLLFTLSQAQGPIGPTRDLGRVRWRVDAGTTMLHPGIAAPPAPEDKTFMQRVLDVVERVGNRVPHPAVIFVALILFVILLSHALYLAGVSVTYEAINPETHELEEVTRSVRSLLLGDGIRFMYADLIPNFMAFTGMGVIIVAMLGVGVAEASGLIGALIRKLVLVASPKALTYILVFVGIM